MNWLVKLLTGGVLGGANEIIKTVAGDKVQKETNTHEESMAASSQLASEYIGPRENRTWWDSFIDGLNRLPRPVITFAVLGLMAYAPFDPYTFSAIMAAYQLVPEWLALIFAQIILLYFGGRMISQWNGKMSAVTTQKFNEVIQQINSLRSLRESQEEETKKEIEANNKKPMSDEAFEQAMADDKRPLNNQAIIEWNRRFNPGFKG